MICFLIHGTKEVVSPGLSLKLNNNQVLLLESGSVLMSETVPENQNYESILFFFSNNYLAEFCIKHNLSFSKPSQKQKNYRAIQKDDFLKNFQTSIALLRQKLLPDLLQLKLEELLLYLFHNYKPEFLSLLNQTSFNTAETIIREVIATHSEEALTIDELAFLCNMSISTFKRQFVSLYNTSPKKYFTGNKMLKAKQLLSFKKSPSDIYHELGYESLSSFSNEFKKHFGISPRQFQKENELRAKVFEPLS
jgi:AraC-like DNA-binding protein